MFPEKLNINLVQNKSDITGTLTVTYVVIRLMQGGQCPWIEMLHDKMMMLPKPPVTLRALPIYQNTTWSKPTENKNAIQLLRAKQEKTCCYKSASALVSGPCKQWLHINCYCSRTKVPQAGPSESLPWPTYLSGTLKTSDISPATPCCYKQWTWRWSLDGPREHWKHFGAFWRPCRALGPCWAPTESQGPLAAPTATPATFRGFPAASSISLQLPPLSFYK